MGKGEILPSLYALKPPNMGSSFKYLHRAWVMMMDWPGIPFRAGGGRGGVGGGPPSLRGFPLDLKCDISWGKIKTRSK